MMKKNNCEYREALNYGNVWSDLNYKTLEKTMNLQAFF